MFAVFAFCPIGTTAREKYHVKEIYLFGSYARGEADAQSDLDFLFWAEMDFVSLRFSSVLCGIASSDRFFLHQESRP